MIDLNEVLDWSRVEFRKKKNNIMSNWFVKDLLGISCAMITWILLFYSEYVTVYVIFIRENSTFHYRYCHLIFFNILFFLSICSHFKTMFTNPVRPLRRQ